jgi:hypothetical protein
MNEFRLLPAGLLALMGVLAISCATEKGLEEAHAPDPSANAVSFSVKTGLLGIVLTPLGSTGGRRAVAAAP